MKIFILEDDQNRIEAFDHVLSKWDLPAPHEITTAKWVHGTGGALDLYKPPYDVILLDHDLGGRTFVESSDEETGFTFVSKLGVREDTHGNPRVVVHSWNPDGARAMGNLLYKNGWKTVIVPFGSDLLKWLGQL